MKIGESKKSDAEFDNRAEAALDEDTQSTTDVESTANEESVNHRFLVKTFKVPTVCDFCNHLMIGVVKQGMQCESKTGFQYRFVFFQFFLISNQQIQSAKSLVIGDVLIRFLKSATNKVVLKIMRKIKTPKTVMKQS